MNGGAPVARRDRGSASAAGQTPTGIQKPTRAALSTRSQAQTALSTRSQAPTELSTRSQAPNALSTRNVSRLQNISREILDETGSLSILIITLFLLMLLFSFLIINVSDAYLAKRELDNVGEIAITRAAHAIDLNRYYSGERTADEASGDGLAFRVPLDCATAESNFQNSIVSSNLRGEAISIQNWQCQADEVSATISAIIPTALEMPLGIGSATTEVTASIGATSIIGGGG